MRAAAEVSFPCGSIRAAAAEVAFASPPGSRTGQERGWPRHSHQRHIGGQNCAIRERATRQRAGARGRPFQHFSHAPQPALVSTTMRSVILATLAASVAGKRFNEVVKPAVPLTGHVKSPLPHTYVACVPARPCRAPHPAGRRHALLQRATTHALRSPGELPDNWWWGNIDGKSYLSRVLNQVRMLGCL